jgi:hypothetical protein
MNDVLVDHVNRYAFHLDSADVVFMLNFCGKHSSLKTPIFKEIKILLG